MVINHSLGNICHVLIVILLFLSGTRLIKILVLAYTVKFWIEPRSKINSPVFKLLTTLYTWFLGKDHDQGFDRNVWFYMIIKKVITVHPFWAQSTCTNSLFNDNVSSSVVGRSQCLNLLIVQFFLKSKILKGWNKA